MATVLAFTKDDVLLIAPELTSVTDAQWTEFIAEASETVSGAAYATDYRATSAAKYLAAHLASAFGAESGSSGVVGPVLSVKVGEVAKTFANTVATPVSGGSSLSASKYGRRYLDIVRAASMARLPIT